MRAAVYDEIRRAYLEHCRLADVLIESYRARLNWDILKLCAWHGITLPVVKWQAVTPRRLRGPAKGGYRLGQPA